MTDGAAPSGWAVGRCPDAASALAALANASALVVAEDALGLAGADALARWIGGPAGPSMPVLLLARGAPRALDRRLLTLAAAPNVTLVQAPLAPGTLAAWLDLAGAPRSQAADRERAPSEPTGAGVDREHAEELGATLVRILGHDLRTPLAAAALSAEVIQRTSADQRALRAAGRVLSATRRMQGLIQQLLDYAHVRQGRELPLQRRECDLAAVCRAVVAEVASAQADARLELEERGDPLGEWDPDRLAQLLTGLLTNAVRHGLSGQPVRVCLDGLAADELRLSVHNAGSVDADVLPVLFEPFQGTAARAAARDGARAYARAGEGLGLGLYVAREIARAHGGEVSVETSDEGGTLFSVSLPRCPTAG